MLDYGNKYQILVCILDSWFYKSCFICNSRPCSGGIIMLSRWNKSLMTPLSTRTYSPSTYTHYTLTPEASGRGIGSLLTRAPSPRMAAPRRSSVSLMYPGGGAALMVDTLTCRPTHPQHSPSLLPRAVRH